MLKTQIKFHKAKLTKAFERVLDSGWYILGQEVQSFEKEFGKYLKVKYCIGVANGLEALQISLMALGVGKGMEIITTPISAVATTLAIMAVGAKPVFVDTNENGLINADLIEKAITKKTKAILPVHLYGQAVDLKKILALCRKYHLHLIEDACQAHGSTYQGQALGTFGIFGCFSFYPTKNLGALGDAGAIVTNNQKLAEACKQIRDYGQQGKYQHSRFGLNSRLDELQAALLRVRLPYLDKENQKRVNLAKRYIKNLTGKVTLSLPDNLASCNFHQFVAKVKNRDQLQKRLAQAGIATLVHYPSIIPDQPFLKKDYGQGNFPIARKFVGEIISLPLNPYMSEKEVDAICSKIKLTV